MPKLDAGLSGLARRLGDQRQCVDRPVAHLVVHDRVHQPVSFQTCQPLELLARHLDDEVRLSSAGSHAHPARVAGMLARLVHDVQQRWRQLLRELLPHGICHRRAGFPRLLLRHGPLLCRRSPGSLLPPPFSLPGTPDHNLQALRLHHLEHRQEPVRTARRQALAETQLGDKVVRLHGDDLLRGAPRKTLDEEGRQALGQLRVRVCLPGDGAVVVPRGVDPHLTGAPLDPVLLNLELRVHRRQRGGVEKQLFIAGHRVRNSLKAAHNLLQRRWQRRGRRQDCWKTAQPWVDGTEPARPRTTAPHAPHATDATDAPHRHPPATNQRVRIHGTQCGPAGE
mmetsp:Transcript_14537/g.41399  ORF Transcript_14537/g.41399 Transcript_14537/m.41399 type:complete len:338 (+) Transcript_14537:136-1149(+)